MTAKERFDKIAAQIERYVDRCDDTAAVIAEKVAQENGMSLRELSAVFQFLTGQSLVGYIKSRKMNAAYEYIIEGEKYDSQGAVEISGLGDQAAYNKRFKKAYGLTPTEAFEKKDTNLAKVSLTWNTLPKIDISSDNGHQANNSYTSKTIYGIDREKFEEIKQILDLQSAYEFDDEFSETAYYIASTYDVSLQEAFLFVGEFVNDRDEDDIEFDKEMGKELPTTIWKNKKERLISHIKSVAADPEVRYVFFDIVGSLAWTYRVIEKFHNAGELDVTQVDFDVLEICAEDDIAVSYCKEAVKYYKEHATDQHGEEAFEEYIDSILCNVPMETAFDLIIRLNDVIEYNSPYCAAFHESDIVDNFTDFSESTDEYTEMYYDYNDEDRI